MHSHRLRNRSAVSGIEIMGNLEIGQFCKKMGVAAGKEGYLKHGLITTIYTMPGDSLEPGQIGYLEQRLLI